MFLLIFIVLSLVLSTSCSQKSEESRENDASKLIYKVADSTGDWGFPAPYTCYSRGPGYVRMSFIFDTLIWKDKTGEFTGALAKDWEYNKKDNAYIFNLRDNATWHDGEKFTAEDVVFTFNYLKEHPYTWSDINSIKNVEAKDEFTIKISLEKPFAPFLANIAGTFPILPKHIYKDIKNPAEYKEENALIGTGPFKLVDYNREQGTYLYEANEDYYLGKPKVDKLMFIKVGTQMLANSLLDGTANTAQIPPEMVNKLKEKDFTVLASDHSWNAKLKFNLQKEPFNNKKFRQAIGYAIDRNRLVEISQRNAALAGSPGLVPEDSYWYNDEILKYDYNLKRSQELLKELGYELDNGFFVKDGSPLTIEVLSSKRYSRDAEIIKEDLEKAGIKIDIRNLEAKTVDAKTLDWDFEIALSGHGGLGGDPQMLNRMMLGKSYHSARFNNNERLNEVLKKQLLVMDKEERKELIKEAQKIYAENLPALSLYYPNWYQAYDGKVDLYYTPGGLGSGIPLPYNKLSFVK